MSRITFYVKIDIHTRLVQSASWTGGLYLFSVIRYLTMLKKPMNRMSI